VGGDPGPLLPGAALSLHGAAVALALGCALCDAGQLPEAAREEGAPLPRRAHRAWLYQLPLRRYDHYCRWLRNAVALKNHREFVLMLACLVSVGLLGALLDAALLALRLRASLVDEPAAAPGAATTAQGTALHALAVVGHLVWSVAVLGKAGMVLQVHTGLISRNELAAEWSEKLYYVTDDGLPVEELSDDEFNRRFDAFVYDASRNDFDRGCMRNCFSFWCVPRWARGQLGEF